MSLNYLYFRQWYALYMVSRRRLLIGSVVSMIGVMMMAYGLMVGPMNGATYYYLFYPGLFITIFGVALAITPDPDQYIEVVDETVDPDLQIGKGTMGEPEGPSFIYSSAGDPFRNSDPLLHRDQPFHEQTKRK